MDEACAYIAAAPRVSRPRGVTGPRARDQILVGEGGIDHRPWRVRLAVVTNVRAGRIHQMRFVGETHRQPVPDLVTVRPLLGA